MRRINTTLFATLLLGCGPEDAHAVDDDGSGSTAPTDASAGTTPDPSTTGATGPDPTDAATTSASTTSGPDDASSTGDEPPAQNGKYVLAHWMIRMGRWNGNDRPQEDYEAVLEEMRDYGVDAAVVYWDDYTQGASGYLAALDAAEATDTKIAWGVRGYQGEDLRDMIVEQKDRPGLFRDLDGRIVISGFFNTWGLLQDADWTLDPAGSVELDDLQARGVDFAYWPDLPNSSTQTRGERVAGLSAAGVFQFFYEPNGGYYTDIEYLESAAAGLADAQLHGVQYMPPIMAYYAGGHADNDRLFESLAFTGIRDQWMFAIDNDVAAVQIVTVNDFNEHHYVQTFGDGAPVVGHADNPLWAGTLVLDHSGFGKFNRRYADWFKTGVEPEIVEDQFLIAYRLHPRTAASWEALTDDERGALAHWLPPNASPSPEGWAYERATRVGSYDLLDDTVQLCVRLAEPAAVTLTVGVDSTTQELPAGEHILVITGAETATELGPKHTFTAEQMGAPHVTVARGDTTVLDTDAPLEITPYILPGTYNYYATELTP